MLRAAACSGCVPEYEWGALLRGGYYTGTLDRRWFQSPGKLCYTALPHLPHAECKLNECRVLSGNVDIVRLNH